MQKSYTTSETGTTWMRFADLLVDTGVISDILENRALQKTKKDDDRVKSGEKGTAR